MIGLAIHTSSPELGLALTSLDHKGERAQVWPLGRDLTTYLHTCLQGFVLPYRWQDVAYIAVSKGPGGFTGTRIGVVVARTLAQQLDIPLFGISSLAAIAQFHQQTLSTEAAPNIAVALPAQRGEIYGGIYQRRHSTIAIVQNEALYTHDDWEAQLQSQETPYHLIQAEGGLADTVSGILMLGNQQWQAGDRPQWKTVLPFYGQHPVHR